jgi:dihydrolipoamide dehydrogenase
MKNYDVIIIGAGPGGYIAAIRASQLGLKAAIVEDKHLGGICLNWGCIPTKALLKASELNYKLKHLSEFGFSAKEISFDFKAVVARSRNVANQLSGGISGLMKKNKVDVINGYGKVLGKGRVEISKNGNKIEEISAKHIVIATGARARVLKGFEPDGQLVLTYKEAMVQETLPKAIAIVGSGAIGCEFASFFQNMGSQVTILEALPRILPVEDEEISKIAKKEFELQGMKIITDVKLEKIEKKSNSVVVHFNGKSEEFEKVIMAVGVVPNIENIGLEESKITKDDRNCIKVDGYLQTNIEGIYAIGDVTQGPWLAHKASHEGVIVAEFIASKEGKFEKNSVHPLNRANIPGCTYTRPQIASVGMTEAQTKEKGLKVKIGRFQPIGNGKAIASGETVGLVKTIFDEKTGELLGVHMIGTDVTEMISAYLVGKQAELVEKDFMQTIFPHPTMSEMMHESVLDAFGKVLHM